MAAPIHLDPKERYDEKQGDGPTETHSPYAGNGTTSEPFIVLFLSGDLRNPQNFTQCRKWLITSLLTLSVLAVTLTSSAYSGSPNEIVEEFNASGELFAAGISLYVLGFAVGPALWAPLSELYGRRILFILSHGFLVAFVAASAGCSSMAQLLVFRFLSGTFGASPLTNAGGVIADIFHPSQRGMALCIFASAPFMGPVIGPIIGGFVSITIGWRWVQGVCAIFIGVVWILGTIVIPETYAPVLLHERAKELSKTSGKFYVSVLEVNTGGVEFSEVFGKALKRPWILLFREPIVLIASTYMAILYGTLYMFLGAYPIVYQQERGWNEGIGGLAFLGPTIGLLFGLIYTIFDNTRYKKLGKKAQPESRMPPTMLGAVCLPVGMFGFAWTSFSSIHWSASIILTAPFGFGTALVFNPILNYLLDAYTIYAASVLAAGAMLRAFIGAAFPLFTRQMYANLGTQWASSVPAFLTVACLPFPFVIYYYGAKIRMKCKYAKEAAILLARLQENQSNGSEGGSSSA